MEDTYIAAMINRLHNAPVIAAWDVANLDEMWLETFFAMAQARQREEEMQRHRAAIQNSQAAWRRRMN